MLKETSRTRPRLFLALTAALVTCGCGRDSAGRAASNPNGGTPTTASAPVRPSRPEVAASLRTPTPAVQTIPSYKQAEQQFAKRDYAGADATVTALLKKPDLPLDDRKFLVRQLTIIRRANHEPGAKAGTAAQYPATSTLHTRPMASSPSARCHPAPTAREFTMTQDA